MAKSVKVLNRTMRWREVGLEIEGDPRRADEVCASGLESAKPTPTARSREDGKNQSFEEELMPAEMITEYRAMAARLNCMANDRPDLKHAAMAASTGLAKPTMADWRRWKRVGSRYLLGHKQSRSSRASQRKYIKVLL